MPLAHQQPKTARASRIRSDAASHFVHEMTLCRLFYLSEAKGIGDMLGYMSVVKFETKPGSADAFVQNVKNHNLGDIEGLIEHTLIQTDENKFTWVAEYDDISSVVNAQDRLVAVLDTHRPMLVDVTQENGVTDPESGQIVNRQSRKVLPGT